MSGTAEEGPYIQRGVVDEDLCWRQEMKGARGKGCGVGVGSLLFVVWRLLFIVYRVVKPALWLA